MSDLLLLTFFIGNAQIQFWTQQVYKVCTRLYNSIPTLLKNSATLLKNNTVQCAGAAREYVLRPVCSTTYGRVHISEFTTATLPPDYVRILGETPHDGELNDLH